MIYDCRSWYLIIDHDIWSYITIYNHKSWCNNWCNLYGKTRKREFMARRNNRETIRSRSPPPPEISMLMNDIATHGHANPKNGSTLRLRRSVGEQPACASWFRLRINLFPIIPPGHRPLTGCSLSPIKWRWQPNCGGKQTIKQLSNNYQTTIKQ